MRLDQFITAKGLAPSRSKAQSLIVSGAVSLKVGEQWIVATSASQKVNDATEVKVTEPALLKYVSRAGLKLQGALEDLKMSVKGFRVFDIGQSTGGFTDCVLQNGAVEVLGIDVGHGQLHESLCKDPRVIAYEGVHISKLREYFEVMDWINKGFDLCVIDVSFISVIKVFEALKELRLKEYEILALIKPQFEVGREALNKAGVVKDIKLLERCLLSVENQIHALGFTVTGKVRAQITGTDGNQEYFFRCK